MQDRDSRLRSSSPKSVPRCHFFNSFFLSKLFKLSGSYSYSQVRAATWQ